MPWNLGGEGHQAQGSECQRSPGSGTLGAWVPEIGCIWVPEIRTASGPRPRGAFDLWDLKMSDASVRGFTGPKDPRFHGAPVHGRGMAAGGCRASIAVVLQWGRDHGMNGILRPNRRGEGDL